MARVVFLALLLVLVARVLWRLLRSVVIVRSPGSRAADATKRSVHMVRDPVCGTFVLPDRALTLADHGRAVHFCSPRCRDTYQARIA